MKNRIFEEQYGKNRTARYENPPVWIRFLQKFGTHRFQTVSDMLPPGRLRVLEIGCGDGSFLYTNRNKWKEIIGIDITGSQLSKARRRQYGCHATFLVNDFGHERMPFKKNSFDICISIATLQYMYDLDLLFGEIHRVLRNGGLLIFEVPNVAVFWRRVLFLSGRLPRTSQYTNAWDAGVIHYFTFHDLKDYCESSGFMVEQVKTAGFLHSFRSIWPDILGADLIFSCRKK